MQIQDSLFIVERQYDIGDELVLDHEEARHMLQVRRLKTGDTAYLTDGAGTAYQAELLEIAQRNKNVLLKVRDKTVLPLREPEVVLAAALPKGDRLSTMLNMATQLGMNRFIPLICEFSVVQFQEKLVDRWHRIIQTACKQSRQCYFPVIDSALTPADLLNQFDRYDVAFFIGDDQGMTFSQYNLQQSESIKTRVLVIGPEAGFSDHEKLLFAPQNSLKSTFRNLNLSDHILRTETAALAMLAAINQLDR